MARHYAEQGDFRSASLSARQLLTNDPRNLEAHRILASISKAANSPEAILWQQKLIELSPGNNELLLDLASTATALGEVFVAEQALGQVNEAGRRTAAFHQTFAVWAVATRQYGLADYHFQEAFSLDPQNTLSELNLATVRLLSSTPEVNAAARAVLEKRRHHPNAKLRRAAVRALLSDAREQNDFIRAMALAMELQEDPDCTLSDRFLFLEELQRARSPQFATKLRALQEEAGLKPEALYALMTWMNSRGLAVQTLALSTTLPRKTTWLPPVPLAIAEACTILGRWTEVMARFKNADWGTLDFLRKAILLHAEEKASPLGRGKDFRMKWDRAVIATGGDPNSMAMLGRLVSGWGWNQEAAQIWWLLARRDAGQRPALQALYRMYADAKNTPELYRVACRIGQVEPQNPVAKNNIAILALLLGEDLREAHRIAEENYRANAREPAFVSTYAFSLYLQNRREQAVQILQKLPESTLRQPSMAACFGVILSSTGDHERARPFLDIALRNQTQLFPEEAALARRAMDPSR